MRRGVGITVALCLTFVAIVMGMLAYSVSRTPELSDQQLRELGTFILPTPREVHDFTLTDDAGEPFTQADLQDRWTFMYFGFTNCPDICPVTLSVLAKVRAQLAEKHPELLDRFQVVLASVDPERDDPATLAKYVHAFSPAFRGLTGSVDAVAALASDVNVAFMKLPVKGSDDPDAYTIDHTGNIVIFNPRGHYHGFIKLPHDVDQVLKTYQTLAARM